MIRLATVEDAEPIQAIYAPIVRETIISFEYEVPTVAEIGRRIRKTLRNFAWLVYEDNNQVLGYAYAGHHRVRTAYQWSADVSVYVHGDARRRGIGRKLYTTLFNILRLQNYVNAYAGISLPNPGSVGLHRAVGMTTLGIYHNVGYKFGAWHDVMWLEMPLQPHPTDPHTPLPLPTIATSPRYATILSQANG